ncbi:uncharacterized protein [Epargyreus clarus]|uniref:uncharacterized protein n=1 Tax=Epargyreus clarus TaxID=520877 RepID=UPI003C2D14DD
MEVDTEKLISSIKIRPALYNKDDSMYYSHKKYKNKLWREVCQEVYKNWNQLSPQDKLEYARELQKRWKSLRTCFSRELALQRKEKIKREMTNDPIKKRKKYEYFNSLIFLLSEKRLEEYNTNKDSESESDPVERFSNIPEVPLYNGTEDQPGASFRMKIEPQYQEPVIYERMPMDERLLDMFKDYRQAESDEDKQFVLSLISYFKQLDSNTKLEARIEVLKLLQRFAHREEEARQYM